MSSKIAHQNLLVEDISEAEQAQVTGGANLFGNTGGSDFFSTLIELALISKLTSDPNGTGGILGGLFGPSTPPD